MKLFTKQIEKAAQKQFPLGGDIENQKVVAKFFNAGGAGTWYLLNQDPGNTDYLWGFAKITELEMGSFSKSELENFRGQFGLRIERDKWFDAMPAKEVWDKLSKGEHI